MAEKPEWMMEFGRRGANTQYSEFLNDMGEQWAFLYNVAEDRIVLSGSDIDWEIKRLPAKTVDGFFRYDAIDLITKAGLYFGLDLDLEERLWLAACLRTASSIREQAKKGR